MFNSKMECEHVPRVRVLVQQCMHSQEGNPVLTSLLLCPGFALLPAVMLSSLDYPCVLGSRYQTSVGSLVWVTLIASSLSDS